MLKKFTRVFILSMCIFGAFFFASCSGAESFHNSSENYSSYEDDTTGSNDETINKNFPKVTVEPVEHFMDLNGRSATYTTGEEMAEKVAHSTQDTGVSFQRGIVDKFIVINADARESGGKEFTGVYFKNNFKEDTICSFYIRPYLDSHLGSFSVYVDQHQTPFTFYNERTEKLQTVTSLAYNEQQHSNPFYGIPWIQASFKIPAGSKEVIFAVKLTGNAYRNGIVGRQFIFLDKVTVTQDVAVMSRFNYQGLVSLRAGQSLNDLKEFALRADGSIKDVKPLSFTRNRVGVVRLGSSYGLPSDKNHRTWVAVYPADNMASAFLYNGKKYTGTTAELGQRWNNEYLEGFSISYPTTNILKADGFFRLKVQVPQERNIHNYFMMIMQKEGEKKQAKYFLEADSNGNFDQRVWLRYGAGTYTVALYKLYPRLDLNGEGDMNAYGYERSPFAVMRVENTREEDGRFIYPSNAIQSDNFKLSNFAAKLIAGTSNEIEKIEKVHNYVIDLFSYDHSSLRDGCRKKQDAYYCLFESKTAVCEGYASACAALLRSVGVSTKCMAGMAYGGAGAGLHAWNRVLMGDDGWYFLDSTWDDPSDDSSYTYFLNAGTPGNHEPQDERSERSILSDDSTNGQNGREIMRQGFMQDAY